MSWSKYNLVFRLHSPLHVGLAKTGNLKQCRDHVPGRLLWAALTARLTRDLGHGAQGRRYMEIGSKVHELFRFSYLYPALPKPGTARISSSVDLDGFSARWKEDTRNFDYQFVGSYASVALDYTAQSSESGALHETEYLLPHTRPHMGALSRQVFLIGDAYVHDRVTSEPELARWQTSIRKLQLGAERKYGWGMVSLVAGLNSPVAVAEPLLQITEGESLPAHAVACTKGNLGMVANIRGEVEPLVGWEYNNDHSGGEKWKIAGEPLICYVPGAKSHATMKLWITSHGVLYSPVNTPLTGDDHGT